MSRVKRILKELEDVQKDTSASITLVLVSESDLSHLTGTFLGPPDTPYANGRFQVDIHIPNEYPFKPPQMKFDTKVYHPNISSVTGAICLDILKDAWTPILTLKSSLISLQSLLQSPEPSDPQDAEVAKHYLSDLAGFQKTAKYWTEIYASADAGKKNGGSDSSKDGDDAKLYGIDEATVGNFQNMGFDRAKIIEVLRRLGFKKVESGEPRTENKVIEELLK
ncbi:hypothetical protein WICPIJ_000758 [Wickerhamomyces pijperi]|uniref:Ubiquitin-conjugating enzyme E2 1 n=1 Tax=Wickerhamomyces pijperi TaxID=599730 RepID=A0A9P8QFH8_WICPI|nr:hypothetical protein WICPIJ_000758 [Wickerhamomyces pijperi]